MTSRMNAVDRLDSISGFFKIWAVDPSTGKQTLLVDKKNMILYSGADLLAKALAGVRYHHISHIYVGYKTTSDMTGFTPPVIDKEYSNKFEDYNVAIGLEDLGYLRLPLGFSPSYLATTNYENNVVIFSTTITANNLSLSSGAPFNDSGEAEPSNIFEIALVAATNPTDNSGDVLFSRANFEPITYDPAFNLSIAWGIQLTTP